MQISNIIRHFNEYRLGMHLRNQSNLRNFTLTILTRKIRNILYSIYHEISVCFRKCKILLIS